MISSINLLRNKNALVKTQNSAFKIKVLRYVSVGLLFIVSVSAMILFFLIYSSPLPKLRNDEANELKKISALHNKSAKLLLTSERILTIRELIKNRTSYDSTIDYLNSQLPQDTIIDAFTQDRKKMIIIVISPTLSSLDLLSERLLTSVEKRELLSSLKMVNLSEDDTKTNFKMTLEASLL